MASGESAEGTNMIRNARRMTLLSVLLVSGFFGLSQVTAQPPQVQGKTPTRPAVDEAEGLWQAADTLYPLLRGTPIHIRDQMPPIQKEVFLKAVQFMQFAGKSRGAVNKFVQKELEDELRREEDKFASKHWLAVMKQNGINDLLGEVDIGSNGVIFRFGDADFRGNRKSRPLYRIFFSTKDISDAAKVDLRNLEEGSWVKIAASLKPDIPIKKKPVLRAFFEEDRPKVSSMSSNAFVLTSIKRIEAP